MAQKGSQHDFAHANHRRLAASRNRVVYEGCLLAVNGRNPSPVESHQGKLYSFIYAIYPILAPTSLA